MKIKHIIILLLFSILSAAPTQRLDNGPVHVYFAQKDDRIAAMSAQVVHDQLERLHTTYQLHVNPVHILIADSKQTYRAYSGAASPIWSMGLATDDHMLVKSPSFSRQSLTEYRQTLLHETVHLALDGIPLPVWFNEGFAQYEAGQFDLQKRIIVSRAFWHHDLMWANEIEQLMGMNRDLAEVAYAQSAAMVNFMIDYFGVSLVAKCLAYTKEFQDFNKGFRNAFLIGPKDFEMLWRQHDKKQYRYYILLNQSNVIWLLLPILLFTGYFLTRIRRKRLLAQWEAEERENATEDSETGGA